MAIKNMAASVLTRLKNQSKEEGIPFSILQRMAGTSRMKDFYDIYYLSGMFDFEGGVLIEAMKSTLTHRKRELSDNVFAEIADFKNNNALNTQWKAFETTVA